MLLGFNSCEAAGQCVAAIIGSGIIPVAIEYMDKPAIAVCEAYAKAGYPLDVEALLIVEVEGFEDEIAGLLRDIVEIARSYDPKVVEASTSAEHSARIWKGRKAAFGAMGRISDYYCMDGTIPLSRLPEVLGQIAQICAAHRLKVANVFHAGDGNLHPLILYNANDADEARRAELAGAEILKLCVAVGGCLTGEHGVGIEKRDLMDVQFSPSDLAVQMRIKSVFDPQWLLEPGQGLPAERARSRRAFASRIRRPEETQLSDVQRPGADWELQFVIAGCAERRLPIEIVGSGSKRAIGRPVDGTVTITTASLRGISLYEPSELVMSARAGTPLSQVEAELAARGQMLPFEPIDLAPATGGPQGTQTIGAVFATNMSGARRIQYGAARDHLLGVKGVNGRAELFQAGGRVMKNVTGYDVSRGLAGSWGTLAVMTEVTFKVIPWPETAATVDLPRPARQSGDRAAVGGDGAARRGLGRGAPAGAGRRAPQPPRPQDDEQVGDGAAAGKLRQRRRRPQAAAQGGAQGLRQGAGARPPRDARVLGRAAPPLGDAEPADAAVAHLRPSRRRRPSSSPPSSATCRPRPSTTGRAASSGSRCRPRPTPAPPRSAASPPFTAAMPR